MGHAQTRKVYNHDPQQLRDFSALSVLRLYCKSGHDKKDDLLSALSCIVRDADAGAFPFRDFCADFGYDEDSRKALKTWKTCKSMEKRLQRVLDGSMISLDTLYNDLSEY